MSALFVPGSRPGAESARVHAELRTSTEARMGCATRAGVIYALDCRREGADSQTRVGDPDPCTGETVHAIFATRDGYTVIWEGGYADLPRRQVYGEILFG